MTIFRTRKLTLAAGISALALLGSFTAFPAKADPTGDAMAAVTAKLAPAVVSIRAVIHAEMKARGQSNDMDFVATLYGVVVSPDGLIMATNGYFSSERLKNAMGVPPDDTEADIKVNPTDLKITIGDEITEYNGTIAASDSNLGLAFIQIRDLKGRTLPFVNFANVAPAPNVGDVTISAMRLGKEFDYAPFAVEDRIAGTITKPRKAYVPEGEAGGLAMPIYDASGQIIGVLSSFEMQPSTNGADRMGAAVSGLLRDDLADYHTQFILPGTIIAPLIGEAKTRAADLPPFVPPTPKPAVVPTTPAKPSGAPATPAKPGASDVITK